MVADDYRRNLVLMHDHITIAPAFACRQAQASRIDKRYAVDFTNIRSMRMPV